MQDLVAFRIGLKHPVLDAVVHHLHIVTGTGRPDVRVALRRRQRLEDRLAVPEGRRGRADHQAVADREAPNRSEEHTSELQSLAYLVCRLLLEKKKTFIHAYK